MASRMDKYQDSIEVPNKRSSRNESLYKKIFNEDEYSNIEGVVTTPKKNEIDLQKIREVLLQKEEIENNKNKLVKKDIELDSPDMSSLDDDKNYDIMDVLKHAKEEKETTSENKYYRLDDEYIEELKKTTKKVEKVSSNDDIKEIKEMLNTITRSIELNKLKDNELCLDMFSDLKSNTATINKDDDLIKSIINEAKQLELKKENDDIDNTFDTKSMKLKAKDYVEKIEDLDKEKKNNPILKTSIILVVVMILIVISYFIIKYI